MKKLEIMYDNRKIPLTRQTDYISRKNNWEKWNPSFSSKIAQTIKNESNMISNFVALNSRHHTSSDLKGSLNWHQAAMRCYSILRGYKNSFKFTLQMILTRPSDNQRIINHLWYFFHFCRIENWKVIIYQWKSNISLIFGKRTKNVT